MTQPDTTGTTITTPEAARVDVLPRFGLDDLRAAIEQEYGPFRIDLPGQAPAVFRPILRLREAERTRVFQLLDSLKAGGERPAAEPGAGDPRPDDGTVAIAADADTLNKQVQVFREVLYLVAQDDSAQRLFTAIGDGSDDDLGVLLPLWQKYQEVTQAGEASPSEG